MFKQLLLSCSLFLIAGQAFAQPSGQDWLKKLQHNWAEASYNHDDDKKEQLKAFRALLVDANTACEVHPNSTELLIWRGIIKSSYAGAKGGLSALGLAKAARDDLEAAIKRDSKALDGAAYISLGVLYSRVPGWPIGFGDDKKAKKLLERGLALNPEGIDINYFFGEYLLENGDADEAEQYFLKAQRAQPRINRPLADAGRHKQIALALASLKR